MKETVITDGGLREVRAHCRARRARRVERRLRRRKARQLAREPRRGKVRVRTRDYLGPAAIQRLQADLPRELMRWSRDRSMRIKDLTVPSVEPRPGAKFTAQGRASDGRAVYVHCTIGPRLPWRQTTDTVKFNIMEAHPEVKRPR
jgi:hypothetical protein